MEVAAIVVAAFIAGGAAVLSSWLTARHMLSVTNTQIAAERARERVRLQVELRRDRVKEASGMLAEVQTALSMLSRYVHAAEQYPSESEMELCSRLGLDEPPLLSFLRLLPEVVFKLPVGPIEDVWKQFALKAMAELPADASRLPGLLRSKYNQEKVVDLRTNLSEIQDAVDAFIVGDDGEDD